MQNPVRGILVQKKEKNMEISGKWILLANNFVRTAFT